MVNNLTQKQEKVLKFIGDYIGNNGEPPTISEIKEFLRVKSLRTVTQYLDILERKGYVYRSKYAKRGIKLIGWKSYFNSELVQVPLIGSAGCDNQTVFAEPNYEYISISRSLVKNVGGLVVGIKAIGQSMIEAGINDGDVVLVEQGAEINNGDRVAVIIDEIAVIKKINFIADAIILKPESKDPSYKPIIVDKNFHIFGKVIRVIKKIDEDDDIQIIPEPD